MAYPAIVYARSAGNTRHADNRAYKYDTQYQVTYISRNPDDPTVLKIALELPQCKHERFFIVNNLNHDVYNVQM